MKQITKATPREVAAYPAEYRKIHGSAPLYPLSHWARIDGHKCAVEYLNEPDGVKYEVRAPKGFHFSEGGSDTCAGSLHGILALDMEDLRSRVRGVPVRPCTEANP